MVVLLAGFCRTLKFVETLRNLETNSLSENTSPVSPPLFPRHIAFRLTEQVTSRSAKGRLGHGETWSQGEKVDAVDAHQLGISAYGDWSGWR